VRGVRAEGNQIYLSTVTNNSHVGLKVADGITTGILGDVFYGGNSIDTALTASLRYSFSGGFATDGTFLPQQKGIASKAWPSDANYTATQNEWDCDYLNLSSGSLTAQRNLVMPLYAGKVWTIFNNTTGAQSIQVIGATGTGIVIANGKRAIVGSDGTNIFRVTADQ
jgi:hypothetical protein